MSYRGDFRVGAAVNFKFATRKLGGGRVDQSSAWEAADLRVYKDNGTTERSSTAGFTITGPFDSMTGITHVTIDLADNTDAGFYASGHDYQVVLYPDETVDGVTVAEVVAEFSIENRVPANAARTVVEGAAVTGTLSSTQATTNLTEATDDHYKGRAILWTSGVLKDSAQSITAYLGSSKRLTYSATPTGESPSNGDTFVIV